MKKAFNIVANVSAIVLMGILLIGAIALLGMIADYSSLSDEMTLMLVVTIILLLFTIATIIIAALALAKCSGGKMRGLQIAVTVLVGIIAILEFVGSTGNNNSNGIVYGILCLIPVGFEIAAMCVKDAVATAQQTNTTADANAPKQQTVDEKIAELKHLKELKAITDEQYESAINALINDVK